ncbi:MAG: hypothetical protein LBC70_00100 [Chitinispirillales bacterium]|jgi:ligand-binding sensor domain-containing protein|nr:hypothetical protein [Chitinispirillales bacterium]
MLKLKVTMNAKRLVPAAVMAVGFIASAGYARQPDSVSFERPNEYKIIASNSPVRAFAVLNNVLWYATEEILISQPLNTRNHQQFPRMGNIGSTGITSMMTDAAGRVWIGGAEGVAMRAGNNFTSYTTENGLPDNSITALTRGSGNEVWAGTKQGAARFRDGNWTAFTTEQGLPSNNVTAMATDSRGRIYIGTDRGIAVFDGTKFDVHNMRNGMSWNQVRAIGIEPNTDVVWAAVGDRDINRYDGREWRQFMEIQAGITSIMNDTRRTYFGSADGILRFNGEEWVSDRNRHGIPVEQVFSMYRDSKGDLWFAMEKGVLCLSNPYRR